MNVTLPHSTYKDCTLEWTKYSNDCPALIIHHKGEMLLKASVNMPTFEIPLSHICIKDWSENEGVLEALIKNGIVAGPDYYIPSGFVYVPVCKILINIQND